VSPHEPVLPAVILPVHNAPGELDACLASLQHTLPSTAELLVINDASTEEETGRVLSKWKAHAGERWRFLENRENLGFVATVNRGMRMVSGDVVLLNSDTEVTQGWLQGMQRCLDSDHSIATATPWTNNGEIASLPVFCQNNPVPADREGVARVIARTGKAGYPDIPTAVGFCMAISRRAIGQLGLFDQQTFGKGYGEENDFSMRARSVGLRNVLCDDVYVVHLGNRSFGPLGLKPNEAAMHRLLALHPDYLELVQQFIRDDPLSARRDELVAALEAAA
jgi:GT2 family glycosyltransferase